MTTRQRTTRKPDSRYWLTIADAAKELGMARATITAAIDAGQMPGKRFGTRRLISRVEWEQYRAGTWQPRPPATKPTELVKRRTAA